MAQPIVPTGRPWAPERGDAAGAPLTGRTEELGHLVALLRDTAERGGHLATVVGEPGIGKTRLLRELAAAAGDDVDVMWGGATEFESHLAFGVFQTAFENFLPSVEPERLAGVGAENLGLLQAVWPALPVAKTVPAQARPLPGDRFRLYRAVRELLESLASDRPVLLVLDDMHWADDGSVELCHHLLRHPPRGPLMIALAYRPRQVPPRLGAAIDEALPQGRATSVALRPLPFAEAGALLPADLDRAAREQLYRLSEGNPLYLEALSRAPTVPDRVRLPEVDPVQPVQVALSREIADLEPTPLLVARAAAIVGDAFEPDVVAEVAQVPDAVVLDALDALVARDVVRPAGTGSRHQFRHPLVRSAAYQNAGAGWRIAGHARAAAALRRSGAPAADQARHVERSSSRGDRQAIGTLVAAAENALDTAPAVAAHWFRAALRLLPDDRAASGPDRLVVLDRLARALGMAGLLTESRQVMHELLALLPRASARRAHAACFCAMVQRLLGEYAEANARLRAELDDLADQDGVTAVIIKIGLAFGSTLAGDFTAERDWAAEAVATARRLDDQPVLAAALTVRALGILMGVRTAAGAVGTRSEAADLLTEASAIVDGLPDPALVDHIDAFAVVGSAEYMMERMGDAERHLRRMLRIARASGRIHLQTNIGLGLGSVLGRTGRLREAQETFDDAVDSALLTGSHEQRSMSLSCRSWILAWTGDVDGAYEAAAEAAGLAGTLPGYFSAATRYRLAYLRSYTGDPDGCIEQLVNGCGGPELAQLDPLSRQTAYVAMSSAEIQRGRPDDALGWAQRAVTAAATSPLVIHQGLADLAMAMATAERDPQRALTCADAAIDVFGRTRDPVFLGYAQVVAGQALTAADDLVGARARFARARELFEASGAILLLGMVERAQRRMNARQTRRRRGAADATATAPVGLTPREVEIARLVADGLTNKQIGERLFLSTRTVESHVARVFTKLGVSTRSAVVHALGQT